MINRIYRLISPHLINPIFEEIDLNTKSIIVRPKLLSICAADQRYFQGWREEEVLSKKLPMSLIHEAVGEVVHDPSGLFYEGEHVVFIPNIASNAQSKYKKNYDPTSVFRSSGFDGYMQDFIAVTKDEILSLGDIPLEAAVLLELFSVAFNAIDDIKLVKKGSFQNIGVWGNGNLGYLTVLALKSEFPNANVSIIGRNREKMKYFTDADSTYYSDNLPHDLKFDLAVECVGGHSTGNVINQIIDHCEPESVISLMGVSEEKQPINTRLVLEKGLILLGSSRSSAKHFKKGIKFLENNIENQQKVIRIISDIIHVKNVNDIYKSFSQDLNNQFKTVMKWDL